MSKYLFLLLSKTLMFGILIATTACGKNQGTFNDPLSGQSSSSKAKTLLNDEQEDFSGDIHLSINGEGFQTILNEKRTNDAVKDLTRRNLLHLIRDDQRLVHSRNFKSINFFKIHNQLNRNITRCKIRLSYNGFSDNLILKTLYNSQEIPLIKMNDFYVSESLNGESCHELIRYIHSLVIVSEENEKSYTVVLDNQVLRFSTNEEAMSFIGNKLTSSWSKIETKDYTVYFENQDDEVLNYEFSVNKKDGSSLNFQSKPFSTQIYQVGFSVNTPYKVNYQRKVGVNYAKNGREFSRGFCHLDFTKLIEDRWESKSLASLASLKMLFHSSPIFKIKKFSKDSLIKFNDDQDQVSMNVEVNEDQMNFEYGLESEADCRRDGTTYVIRDYVDRERKRKALSKRALLSVYQFEWI